MNELKLTNQAPAKITFDKDKTIADVKNNLKKYYNDNGFIPLDESDLPDSKKELATLIKVSKAFNDKKIAVKKELSVEILQFENDVKEVIAVVKNVIDEFDTQIKDVELAQKWQRKIDIMEWQEFECISQYENFNEDWLKKSWTNEKLIEEFTNIKIQLDSDISTIKMLATSHNLESDTYV